VGEIHELGVPSFRSSPQVRRIKLQVVPDAASWPLLKKEASSDRSPFMSGKGDGGVDLLCGSCSHILADHIYPADKISGLVLCCPVCSAYNLA
jgi:hypothetical protein